MNILVIAPHRDDEMLGVGGTIIKRKAAGDTVSVCVVTAKEGGEWGPLTIRVHKEMEEVFRFCGVDHYYGLPFAPVILEGYPRKEINKAIYDVIQDVQPEEVYIPHWGDMQKDHQIVTEAAMVSLRSKHGFPVQRIYAYETLSETGIHYPSTEKAFIPNVYVDITDVLEKKKSALRLYHSQIGEYPDLRSVEAIEALAKFRGATVNVKAAEAFVLIREVK